jgi:hypothetical protein
MLAWLSLALSRARAVPLAASNPADRICSPGGHGAHRWPTGDLTRTVQEMGNQLKVRERAPNQQERSDTQQERIDLAAKENMQKA